MYLLRTCCLTKANIFGRMHCESPAGVQGPSALVLHNMKKPHGHYPLQGRRMELAQIRYDKIRFVCSHSSSSSMNHRVGM